MSSIWGARFEPAVELVSASAIGAVDDTWVDQGGQIDMQGFNTLGIYIEFNVDDSTGNQLQVLSEHTKDGTDAFVLATASDYQKTIGNSDIDILYVFKTDGVVPFVQLQTKATDVDTGGGTVGTMTITYTRSFSD